MKPRRLASLPFTAALIVLTITPLARPAAAATAPRATWFDVGDRFACAVMAAHRVECWGLNDHGQLGDGTVTKRETPVRVKGITRAVSVSSGLWHACAVLSTGDVEVLGSQRRRAARRRHDLRASHAGHRAGHP